MNSQVHSRLGVSPNELVLPSVNLNKNLFGGATGQGMSHITINKQSKSLRHASKDDAEKFNYQYFLQHMRNRQELILELAKQSIKNFDDARIGDYSPERTEFPVDSYVLVEPTKSMSSTNRRTDKVHTPLRGPLKVVSFNKNTYSLRNLVNSKIETYNIQRLRPFYVDEVADDPIDIAMKDSDNLYIESVIEHKPLKPTKVSSLQFLVKWQGYADPTDRTWESWSDNETLKKNKIILRYMSNNNNLRRFISKNVNFDSSDDES
jgi:hypothetical protein